MDEADEYMRNIIFNVVNYPRLTITIPYYDENIKHDSSIHLDSTIADNSSVPERLIAGQFTRLSCKISVADAYDAMTSMRSYRSIIPQMYVREELIKGMGTQFDPEYARIMLQHRLLQIPIILWQAMMHIVLHSVQMTILERAALHPLKTIQDIQGL